MDKPEDKQPPQGPLKPPVPPPFGKKPGQPVPKGPVPPRVPGVPGRPNVPPPSAGAPRPPLPSARPPMPSISGKPPLPPMPGMPGARPPMPPAAGGVPGAPLPPNVQNKFSEAEAATSELETKISDLEKKLLEEREKVLLASLRSKEEEAVSQKVETSIKEIQDKLRREKREQELEENRRKAETRVAEMERRLAEERETWVSTLKNQLGQRDAVTQEMESHFSARLKDLEFRWAQEKASLEATLREREGEIVRTKQEAALKSEQEKGFWEDRLRSVAGERDKIERELERLRDRGDQEKAQLITERQLLRDQVAKAENALKFADDHARSERSAYTREAEATINMIRSQVASEKENYERQLSALAAQTQNFMKEIAEKSAQAAALEQQVSQARANSAQTEARVHGLDSQVEEWRRRAADVEQAASVKRVQYEHQLDELRRETDRAKALAQEEASRAIGRMEAEFNEKRAKFDADIASLNEQVHKARATAQDDATRAVAKAEAEFVEKRLRYENEISNIKEELTRARAGSHEELVRMQGRLEADFSDRRRKLEDELVQVRNQFLHDRQALLEENARFKAESEARIRTLQARVDWYDANAKREYEVAREKVAGELEASNARAETAERAMQEISAVEQQRLQAISDANLAAQRADEIRAAVQAELDQTRTEWKQVQWELENRIKQMAIQISDQEAHAKQMEEGRVSVEQELRQRAETLDHAQITLKQQMDELNRLKEIVEQTSGDLELERERARAFQQQLDGYKEILQGRGVKTVDELKEQLDAKAEALEKAREVLARMANQVQDAEKKEDLFREKERIFKQMVADKDEQLNDFKKKSSTLETRLVETQNELTTIRESAKREKDMLLDQRQGDAARIQERVGQETERLARQFKEERDRIAKAQQDEAAQLAAKHAANLAQVRKEAEERLRAEIEAARREVEDRLGRDSQAGPAPEALEAEIRQRLEAEFADRIREAEGKAGTLAAASKKEIDKIKWDAENLREELKRARETRAHIEREAQELLGQAEVHFKKEVERVRADATKKAMDQKVGGMFSALGRFLDAPLLELGGPKKKKPVVQQKQPDPKQKAPEKKAEQPPKPQKQDKPEPQDKQQRPAA